MSDFKEQASGFLDLLGRATIVDTIPEMTKEDCMEIIKEIVGAIPAMTRDKYPEEDIWAAIAFAPKYYNIKYSRG